MALSEDKLTKWFDKLFGLPLPLRIPALMASGIVLGFLLYFTLLGIVAYVLVFDSKDKGAI